MSMNGEYFCDSVSRIFGESSDDTLKQLVFYAFIHSHHRFCVGGHNSASSFGSCHIYALIRNTSEVELVFECVFRHVGSLAAC